MAVRNPSGGGTPPMDPDVERVIMELRDAKRRGALRAVVKASLGYDMEDGRDDADHTKRLSRSEEELRQAILNAADALQSRPVTEAEIRMAEARLGRQRGKAAKKARTKAKPAPSPKGNVVRLR